MLKNPIVWIDLEMTGLDLKKERIIEISVICSDGNLEKIVEGPNVVINQPVELLNQMDEWCTNQHRKSGLTKAVLESNITTKQAEKQVLDFIKTHIPQGVGVLAGNSIHMDKGKSKKTKMGFGLNVLEFLRKEMPDLLSYLHYRLIDVSTIKELSKRWFPEAFSSAPKKNENHRALDDIKDSITELKYYRNTVFKKSTDS